MKKKFTDKQIKILDVAEELIAKKGFDGTSVRDICTKANINVAMISYYFGSKEKMMSYLYQYRVQRTKESFSEFAQTIKEGKPEMQMKEIINYIVSLLFKYSYFHGFITQEIRIVSGVFHNAPKSEDVLTMIIGSTLFVIRNRSFYELYIPATNEAQYMKEAEQKLRSSILLSVFALLDYDAE